MRLSSVWPFCATLGPVGYIHGGGTLATLITLPFAILLSKSLWDHQIQLAVIIIMGLVSYLIINKARASFKDYDPGEIVLDESLGCLITFYMIPISWLTIILGFLLFRFFDIVKPLGIKRLELLSGTFGIIIDDVVAALLSNGILHLLLLLFSL